MVSILSPLDKAYKITTTFYDKVILGPRTGTQHNAVDYSTPVGTPIYAVTDGVISRADAKDVWGGNIIQLDNAGNGVTAIYAHLQSMYVRPGQAVKAGQIIGTTGNTGKATTGPHLYFEVRDHGTPVDPLKVINGIVNPKDAAQAVLASVSLDALTKAFEAVKAKIPGVIWHPGGNVPNSGAFGQIDVPDSYSGCPTGWLPGFLTFGQAPNTHMCYLADTSILPGAGAAAGAADVAGATAAVAGAVLNPANWAKILAIAGGAGLIVWGGIMLYNAT